MRYVYVNALIVLKVPASVASEVRSSLESMVEQVSVMDVLPESICEQIDSIRNECFVSELPMATYSIAEDFS